MQVKMVFQVSEIAFNAVSCRWYFAIVEVMEHVRQSSVDGKIRAS
jgi:hypothetical protein